MPRRVALALVTALTAVAAAFPLVALTPVRAVSCAPFTRPARVAGRTRCVAALGLTPVGSFSQPVGVITAPDGAAVVIERTGRLVRLDSHAVVLDVTALVTLDGERGLLGAAYAADGREVYIDHTDTTGDIHVAAYALRADGTADPASRRELLTVPHRQFSNHNGGQLVVRPDGTLLVGVGDGGGGGDPFGNGQRLDTLLGKILRVDPRPGATLEPADNPFVGVAGARAEIWAYGLRNPWRFSLDPATGDLWIGDVGQDRREEIDLARAPGEGRGANYGWNRWEGNRPYRGGGPGTVPPLLSYPHTAGRCSVIGGVVARGAAASPVQGWYLYGDFCGGRVVAARVTRSRVVTVSTPLRLAQLTGFGTDSAGRVYVTSITGTVARLDAV